MFYNASHRLPSAVALSLFLGFSVYAILLDIRFLAEAFNRDNKARSLKARMRPLEVACIKKHTHTPATQRVRGNGKQRGPKNPHRSD